MRTGTLDLGARKIKGGRHLARKVDIAETQQDLRQVNHDIAVLELQHRKTEIQEEILKKLWDKKHLLLAGLRQE